MFRFRPWLRRTVYARRRRQRPPVAVFVEPLEDRIVLNCTFGAQVMAVSTHLVGSFDRADMGTTQKPMALMRDAAGDVYTTTLRDALYSPLTTNPDLAGVPQGLDAFAAVAQRLGVATPQTAVNGSIAATGSPMPMGGG